MVTLIKRCRRHGVVLGENAGKLEAPFTKTFPEAHFDDDLKEWVIAWEKGFFAQSNAVLEDFFTGMGEKITHIDKC